MLYKWCDIFYINEKVYILYLIGYFVIKIWIICLYILVYLKWNEFIVYSIYVFILFIKNWKIMERNLSVYGENEIVILIILIVRLR